MKEIGKPRTIRQILKQAMVTEQMSISDRITTLEELPSLSKANTEKLESMKSEFMAINEWINKRK